MPGPGPRPSNSRNHAYEAEECPILHAWPEFAFYQGSGTKARDAEISDIVEARALAAYGSGYRPHHELNPRRERER
jgi:hypothetical protein